MDCIMCHWSSEWASIDLPMVETMSTELTIGLLAQRMFRDVICTEKPGRG